MLLTYGTDYAWEIDQGDAPAVLVRLNGLWPASATIPVNRLAANVDRAWGCTKVVYVVNDAPLLAVARRAAILEGTTQYRSGIWGVGFTVNDSMDGASVSVKPFVRRPGVVDARDSFLNPMTAVMLKPSRRTAYA
jgi:hypothetical protein